MPDPMAWLAKQRNDKREWREHTRRVDALPHDYKTAYKLIEKYVWNIALDGSSLQVLYGIRDLFEEAAAAGRPVLDVTGDDVAGFVRETLAGFQAATWTGKKGDELNESMRHTLGGES